MGKTMLTLFSKQITKAIDECKSSAVMAKKFVGNIETRKWSIKKKSKMRAYQVTADEDDEYVSWGSDFDESCSDDGTDGRNSRTTGNCDNNEDDVENEEDDEEDEDDDDEHVARLTGRCGSYSLSETDGSSSCQLRNINCASTFDNTYEAISETPSTSSYCGSSENSSTFYETPPERRRGSCPSEKSSSGIGEMNGSTRSNSGDDRSELSEHCSVYGYSLNNSNNNSGKKSRTSQHQHPHQLSVEVTSEYIMRELNRKKRSFLHGCEASSETSSGQCSEPSPKARIRPLVKPAIPPKPNIAQFNSSKPGSPGTRRKVRRKIVRPTGEPPPPPIPKSPPPISPASSKLSLTDRLAELTLDDLNEVLGVQLSSDPEDSDTGNNANNDIKGDRVTSGSTVTLTASNIEKVTAAAEAAEAAASAATALETKRSKTTPKTLTSPSSSTNLTLSSSLSSSLVNCKNNKSSNTLKDEYRESNPNLTKSDHQVNNQEHSIGIKMGLINDKISKFNDKHSDDSNYKKGSKLHSKKGNKGAKQLSPSTDVDCIVNDVDDDFGDYETPLNFKYPPMPHNLSQPVDAVDSRTLSTGSNNGHNNNNNNNNNNNGSTCPRMVSRSSSVASGSYIGPDSGFSDCTGISPYPISPPPPFDDNYCCSCRRLMKSVGSTPNLHAIRSSSRSDLSLSPVTSTSSTSTTTPLLPSFSSSMKNQSNLTTSKPTPIDNDSHNSSSFHHQHYHHHHHHHHQHHNNHHSHHSHSTSNLSLLTVDRPKLPRSKPDCGSSNSNNNNNNSNNNSLTNGNQNNHNNNNNSSNNSSGISFKAEIAAKFAEKAAFAKKIINSRPPFKPFESIYATGKSFGFSSSSSSANSSSLNHNNNINRSGSTCNLAQRPLPPLPDDVMPIEKYSWFHGLERDSAAVVLKNLGTEGAYLVRPSKRAGSSNPLTLSILHEGKVFHLNVRRRSDGLYCLGKEKDKERTFESVPALIRFHQKEPILLTTKGESAGITKLMVTPISSSSISNLT